MSRYLSFVKIEVEIFTRKTCCAVPCNLCWVSLTSKYEQQVLCMGDASSVGFCPPVSCETGEVRDFNRPCERLSVMAPHDNPWHHLRC